MRWPPCFPARPAEGRALLSLRRVELPTPRCRPVLARVAFPAPAETLAAAEHLLGCATFRARRPLLARRRPLPRCPVTLLLARQEAWSWASNPGRVAGTAAVGRGRRRRAVLWPRPSPAPPPPPRPLLWRRRRISAWTDPAAAVSRRLAAGAPPPSAVSSGVPFESVPATRASGRRRSGRRSGPARDPSESSCGCGRSVASCTRGQPAGAIPRPPASPPPRAGRAPRLRAYLPCNHPLTGADRSREQDYRPPDGSGRHHSPAPRMSDDARRPSRAAQHQGPPVSHYHSRVAGEDGSPSLHPQRARPGRVGRCSPSTRHAATCSTSCRRRHRLLDVGPAP